MTPDPVSDLCLTCGLCCDGTLFTHIRPRGDELETVPLDGLFVLTKRDGTRFFGLPCPSLEGACCQRYQTRPQGCRAFVCTTARRLAAGQLTEAAAQAVVNEALRLREVVKQELPAEALGQRAPVIRLARQHGLVNGPEALRALEVHLAEHFTAPDDPAATSTTR